MSFDYFNTSHLAFGSKLTKAFRQLEDLCDTAEGNLNQLFTDLELFDGYINKNYRCPRPSRSDAPSRTNEIFDIFNDRVYNIKYLGYSNGTLTARINLFNRVTNRMTSGVGTTELTEGYAFVTEAISNSNVGSNITFVENSLDGQGRLLFKFRVDSSNRINIIPLDDSLILFNPAGVTHVTSMSKGAEISSGYTATDYETICVVGLKEGVYEPDNQGSPGRLYIDVNGQMHTRIEGRHVRKYAIVYLKPGEVLSGTFSKAFKIIYS